MARVGLTSAEAARRVAQGLVNRVPGSDWADYRGILSRNLFTLFNALVVPAAVALFLLHDYRGAWAVSAMAVINTIVALAQELRAKRHLDRLAILTEARVRVVRDGETRLLPSGDVVLGDLILLTAGEPVVADGTLIAARFLEVDEALLTGESDAVPRQAGDRLLSGSFCVAGEATYQADKVGGQALANETAAAARRYHFVSSPLQRTIDRLLRILTGTAVVLCIAYVGLQEVRRFPEEGDLVRMIAATVTSMVPQGLVLMTTLAFTLGAVRMTARGALVQRLNAVESMASVNVLCMDKTGTLTTNRLELDQVRTLDNGFDEAEVRRLLRLFANHSIDQQSKSIQALRKALGDASGDGPAELLDQVPFKSQNRYSAVRLRVGAAETSLVLGAFETLRPFLAAPLEKAEASWNELTSTGLRLLLFAEADGSAAFNGSLVGQQLRPLALVALSDELRAEAGDVLQALAAQGIRFKILSGDHPETVRATVGHLPLALAREPVVTGDELAAAANRDELIRMRSVFGRLTPQQKIEIVTALQAHGDHVAMIGDGINDILSIKRADLGIAMGEGSSATKTVAGIVLENNNFKLLPATLEEGRNILRNLRRAGKLFLLKNVYTFFLIVVATGLCGLSFPYLPQQVTLLNALTIGVPAFLITLGRGPSVAPERRSYLHDVGEFAVTTGLAIGAAGLVVLLISAWGIGDDVRTQRTLLLTTLVLLGIGSLRRVLGRGKEDRILRGLSLAALPAYAAMVYWPLAADFFQLMPMTAVQWGLVLGVAGPAWLLCKLWDWRMDG